jgi:hypothetical protein
MMYFECVYETHCCGHTICDECAVGLLEQEKGALNAVSTAAAVAGESTEQPDGSVTDSMVDDGEITIPLTPRSTSSTQLPIPCPFCRQDGLTLKVITPGEAGDHLRSYDDSPSVSVNGAGHTPSRSSRNSRNHTPSSSCATKPSPLKIGDSFEKMMAKMVPLEGGQPGQEKERSKVAPSGRPPLPPRTPQPPRGSTPAMNGGGTGVMATTPGQVPNARGDALGVDAQRIQPINEENREDHARIPGVSEGVVATPDRARIDGERFDNAAMGTPIGVQPATPIGVQPATPIGAQPLREPAVQAVA